MFCLLSVQQFQHTAKKSHKPQAKTKNSKDKSFEAKTHTKYFKKTHKHRKTKKTKTQKTQKARSQTVKQKLTNINEQT